MTDTSASGREWSQYVWSGVAILETGGVWIMLSSSLPPKVKYFVIAVLFLGILKNIWFAYAGVPLRH